MKTTREAKKSEALDRMRAIGIFPETIRQFEEEGLVSMSAGPLAACYWINEEQRQRVKEFEEKHNALVYHIIAAKYAEIGETEAFFFVGDDPEEWPLDRDDLEGKQAFCFVENLTHPDLSEFGPVGFELGPAAGLLRSW